MDQWLEYPPLVVPKSNSFLKLGVVYDGNEQSLAAKQLSGVFHKKPMWLLFDLATVQSFSLF